MIFIDHKIFHKPIAKIISKLIFRFLKTLVSTFRKFKPNAKLSKIASLNLNYCRIQQKHGKSEITVKTRYLIEFEKFIKLLNFSRIFFYEQ